MPRSMTGYGRCQQVINGRDITVELKSVNHRYFEFSCRLPRSLGYLEDKLKGLVQGCISRGKCDLFLSVGADAANTVRPNLALAEAYLAALRELAGKTGLPDDVGVSQLMRLPDVFTVEKAAVDEDALWQDVREAAERALSDFVAMRRAEGDRLRDDILARLDAVAALVGVVKEQSPRTVAEYRERLYQKLSALLADRTVDDARVLTEAAIFADRVAVDEETVRIESHLAQFRSILSESEPVGRKLDFLTQELNREANTIGSKTLDAPMAAVVVQLKSELEKIREQIQNIE